MIHVRGKGNKDRRIPVEEGLIRVLECYLDSRAVRFPADTSVEPEHRDRTWPATAALFAGSNVRPNYPRRNAIPSTRSSKKAGLNNQRARGGLIHALRHTSATDSPTAT